MRSKLKKESKKISKTIAKLFKDEVISQNLIDTGLMRDSFRVQIVFNRRGDLEIFVSAINYFKFIDQSPHFFRVSEAVFKSKKYKTLEKKLLSLMATELLLKLPKEFSTSDTVTYNFIY
jgi:hypothetical protein